MAVGFGLVLTDLFGWTFVTRFAVAERGRLVAFFIALPCFVASIAVTVTLALYRTEVLRLAEANVSAGAAETWLQELPPIILLPLEALLFIGTAFAFMSLETFVSAIVALLLAVGGVGLGAAWLILGLVDLLADGTVEAAKAIPQSIEPITKSSQTGLRSAGGGIAKGIGVVSEKFRNFLRPSVPRRPTITAGDKELNPPVEEPGQQPAPNDHDAHA